MLAFLASSVDAADGFSDALLLIEGGGVDAEVPLDICVVAVWTTAPVAAAAVNICSVRVAAVSTRATSMKVLGPSAGVGIGATGNNVVAVSTACGCVRQRIDHRHH